MTKLRMKCPHCGCWNRFEVDKFFVPQPSPEPKVKALIPMYKPLKTERCEKCGKVIAEPNACIFIPQVLLKKTGKVNENSSSERVFKKRKLNIYAEKEEITCRT